MKRNLTISNFIPPLYYFTHTPHYTVQARRARGKRAVSRLTSRFRVASYCRRVDLVRD